MPNSSFSALFRACLSQLNIFISQNVEVYDTPNRQLCQDGVLETPNMDVSPRHSTEQWYRGGFGTVSSLLLFCTMGLTEAVGSFWHLGQARNRAERTSDQK